MSSRCARVRHSSYDAGGSATDPTLARISVGRCMPIWVGLPTDSKATPAMIKRGQASGIVYDKLTAIRIARRCDRDRRRKQFGHLFLPRPVTYSLLPQSETSLSFEASLSGACSIPEHAHDQQAT
jgi:hypothetical protein